MSDRDVIAPCTQCRTVTDLRPYGDQDAMICFECAQEQARRVSSLVTDAASALKRLT